MYLPLRFDQGPIIVDSLNRDPRQTIAAVKIACFPLAQRAMAIIDRDLGYRSKHPFSQRIEFRESRKHDRSNARADEIGEPPLCGREREHTIGGLDQSARKGDTLDLVGV